MTFARMRVGSLRSLGARVAVARRRGARAEDELTVYTALETDQLKAYTEGFNKALSQHRDQVGARLDRHHHRRRSSPRKPIRRGHRLGVSATSMAVFANEGMLQPYAPEGSRQDLGAVPRSGESADVGRHGRLGRAICFNTVEAAKLNMPKPETWQDLTKPVYKGRIVMPNPASSGTGYLDVTGWIQMMGEANGVEVHGRSSREHRAVHAFGLEAVPPAAAGEFPIGMSFEYRAVTRRSPVRRSTSSSRPKAWAGISRRPAS